MRLLSVIHGPVFGGAHNQLLRLEGPLKARGCETVALLPDEPGNALPRLRDAGIEVVTMALHRLRASARPAAHAGLVAGFPREVWAIRQLIRDRGIDVVQAHGPTNPHAAVAAQLERRALVWQLYDTRTPMALRRLTMPAVVRLADVITSWGLAVAQAHPGAGRLGERLIPVFPPVEAAGFERARERRQAARARLAAPDGATVIGTVGNLNPQKGHEHLVRAFARVRAVEPRALLRVLGAPSPAHPAYERMLRAEAGRLGLDPHAVDLLDPGDRVPELLPGIDVFALTSVSRSEGMPTAIVEAMACGLPVVATDVGSVSELVEDGITGIVVAPEDPGAVAAACLRLMDPATGHSMGDRGRRRTLERYDLDALADLHLRAYRTAIAHRRSRRRDGCR